MQQRLGADLGARLCSRARLAGEVEERLGGLLGRVERLELLAVDGERVVDLAVLVGVEVFPLDGLLDEEEVPLGVVGREEALADALLVDEAHVAERAVLLVVEERLGEEEERELVGVVGGGHVGPGKVGKGGGGKRTHEACGTG